MTDNFSNILDYIKCNPLRFEIKIKMICKDSPCHLKSSEAFNASDILGNKEVLLAFYKKSVNFSETVEFVLKVKSFEVSLKIRQLLKWWASHCINFGGPHKVQWTPTDVTFRLIKQKTLLGSDIIFNWEAFDFISIFKFVDTAAQIL